MNEGIIIYKSGDSTRSFDLYSPIKKSFNKLRSGFVVFPLIGLIFISLPFVVGELSYLFNKNNPVNGSELLFISVTVQLSVIVLIDDNAKGSINIFIVSLSIKSDPRERRP